ncbi:MAG: nitrile hydratase accessory protein [Mycobacterium sp.]
MNAFDLVDVAGLAAPPRSNGEVVFDAPWQQRIFGMTLALTETAAIPWETFRTRLIGRIAEDQARPYWQSWAAALEDVLAASAMLLVTDVDTRQNLLAQRQPGHDHRPLRGLR